MNNNDIEIHLTKEEADILCSMLYFAADDVGFSSWENLSNKIFEDVKVQRMKK